MLYEVGQYAWPGTNAVAYALAFAVVVCSLALCYNVYKSWNPNAS